MTGSPPPCDDTALVERYLEHVRVEKRLAPRTVELYALDLKKLAAHAAAEGVGLTQVQNAQVRRWVARMHAGGRSGRGRRGLRLLQHNVESRWQSLGEVARTCPARYPIERYGNFSRMLPN